MTARSYVLTIEHSVMGMGDERSGYGQGRARREEDTHAASDGAE